MPHIKVLLMSVCILVLGHQAFSQTENEDKPQIKENPKDVKKRTLNANNAVLISIFYSPLAPIGQLSERFGFSNNVGMNISFKVRHNFIIGLEGAYLFGTHVKENPLNAISTGTTGQLIGQDNSLNDVPLQLSGFEIAFRVGKLFPILKKQPNSGIVFSLAPGFMQHKIWIHSQNSNSLPQINSTYLKGYDRLTNGPSVGANLGYQYIGKKKILSFYAGVDFEAGFTEERRNWDFELMSADKSQRLDMFIGARLAWVIPIFTNKQNEVYYY